MERKREKRGRKERKDSSFSVRVKKKGKSLKLNNRFTSFLSFFSYFLSLSLFHPFSLSSPPFFSLLICFVFPDLGSRKEASLEVAYFPSFSIFLLSSFSSFLKKGIYFVYSPESEIAGQPRTLR